MIDPLAAPQELTAPGEPPPITLRWFDVLAPLWPLGYAVLQIRLLRIVLQGYHEPYEQKQYLALGTLFVAVVWGVERLLPVERWPRAGRALRLACAGALLPVLASAWASAKLFLSLQARGMLAGMAWLPGRASRWAAHWASVPVFLGVGGMFGTFYWWGKWLRFVHRTDAVAYACGAALLCAVILYRARKQVAAARLMWLDGCLLVGLGVLCWRSNDMAPYHYGFIVGPAELVRHGAQVLWDVPLQYGLLSTLLIAHGPAQSAWFNLYALNALLSCVMVAVLYLALADLRRDVPTRLLAAAITAAAVLLLPGNPATLSGTQSVPTSGAMRFAWLFMLVAAAAYGTDGWHASSHTPAAGRRRAQRALLVGSGIWLVALFWSVEVAAWGTATWGPAAICLYARAWPTPTGPTLRQATTRISFALALAAVLATLAATGFYAVWYGHAPDLWAYVDFARAYGASGFGGVDVRADGTVWALLTLYALLVWTCAQAWPGCGLRGFPPVLAAATFSFWACCSYFVSRSDESNATCLMPMVALCGAVLLRLAAGGAFPARVRGALPLHVIPLFCVVVALAYHDPRLVVAATTRGFFDGAAKLRAGTVAEPEARLAALMMAAAIDCNDALSYAGPDNPGHMAATVCHDAGSLTCRVQSHFRPWLPLHPSSMMRALPARRRAVYLQRYLARTGQTGGWFLDHKAEGLKQDRWIADYLAEHYQVVETYENETFRARRFQLRTGLRG